MQILTQKCNCCKQTLMLVSFHRDKNLRHGHRYTCKRCANLRARHSQRQLNIKTSGLYSVLRGMIKRCCNPRSKSYYRYGGRGIRICETWLHTPGAFYSWAEFHGYRSGLQIDRIDNDSNYCPSNCRWVTPKENSRGSTATKLSKCKVMVIKDLLRRGYTQAGVARVFNVNPSTVSNVSTGKTWSDIT